MFFFFKVLRLVVSTSGFFVGPQKNMKPLLLVVGSASADFLWGTATASYQVEGYRTKDERQPSVWDAFDTDLSTVIRNVRPDGSARVYKGQTGAHADEDYKRFDETAELVSDLGFDVARISVSWGRVMTYNAAGEFVSVNEAGLAHYSEVVASFRKKGVLIALTMFHWDLPLVFEEKAHREGSESAWLSREGWLQDEFKRYAELLYSRFSDDIAYWITLNEPLTIVQNGYSGAGNHAPGRCSDRNACYAGDDAVEPYIAAKNLILAHAAMFEAWNDAGKPGSGCGITLNGDGCVPFTAKDEAAATRCLEFQIPLFYDPIFYGKWPDSVNNAVQSRPIQNWDWTQKELDIVKGSHDSKHFFTNTYTSRFVQNVENARGWSFGSDPVALQSGYNFTSGAPIGTPSSNGWLFNYGKGIRTLLNWYDDRYPNRTFIVTENGWGNATQKTINQDLDDTERCLYYRDYVTNVSAAVVDDDLSVAAYFAWSVLDNFEWADGYSTRFGLVYVDYHTQLRTPKNSARYFQNFITNATDIAQLRHLLPPSDTDLAFRKKPLLLNQGENLLLGSPEPPSSLL